MTRRLVVDGRFSCRAQRPEYGVGAMSRLDDLSVSSDEPDDVGWLTGLGRLSEERGRPWRVPAIAAQDHDRCWSQLP